MKDTVDICGVPFRIIRQPSNGRTDGNLGKCDSKLGEIRINEDLPEEVANSTLVHEWVHGVLDMSSIDHSEVLVSVLANELYRKGFNPS